MRTTRNPMAGPTKFGKAKNRRESHLQGVFAGGRILLDRLEKFRNLFIDLGFRLHGLSQDRANVSTEAAPRRVEEIRDVRNGAARAPRELLVAGVFLAGSELAADPGGEVGAVALRELELERGVGLPENRKGPLPLI